MYQIIINHAGLSIGEIEAINNLFKDYMTFENTIDYNYEFASALEIEFIKDKEIEFFDSIDIEKWSDFLDIIKNIKKRRGKKGLDFKITITNITMKFTNNEKENYEIVIHNKIIFALNHKNDYDFIKGVERIEITLENFVDINNNKGIQKDSRDTNQLNSILFLFNEIKRKWIAHRPS